MIGILDVLGIHEGDIEHAWECCCDTLKQVLLSEKTEDLEERLKDEISNYLDPDDITNSIIWAMIDIAASIIEDEYPNITIETYVNGYDSHIDIKEINLFNNLKGLVEKDYIKKVFKSNFNEEFEEDVIIQIAKSGSIIEEIIDYYDENGHTPDSYLYESIEDLGEDNWDNEDRKEDDTDESFGMFLINAYKDGNSKSIYYLLDNGMVFSADMD